MLLDGSVRDLAANVLEMARRRGIMIATAESCTGGMVSAALTDIPGSSDVFERGFITYSNDAKSDLLGVPADLICAHGAVSHEVALAMSAGAVARSKAGVAIALTGVAGPGGAEAKPEGLVWFGICHIGQPPYAEQRLFGAIGRDNVRRESVRVALELMSSALR